MYEAMMSAGTPAKHRLYFSTKCRHCQAFMAELITTPFVREVAAVCVDPSPTRPPLPPWLKSVPTLVVVGESSPRVGPGPVNNWLFERRLAGVGGGSAAPRNSVTMDDRRIPAPSYKVDAVSRPDTTSRVGPVSRGDVSVSSNGRLPAAISSNTEGDKNASPPVLAGSSDDSKVKPYFNLEMSGKSWSDIYSFLKERARGEDDDDMITRNFELLSGMVMGGGGGGGAGSGSGAARATSEKEAALLREFEAYSASRDRDVKGPVMRK